MNPRLVQTPGNNRIITLKKGHRFWAREIACALFFLVTPWGRGAVLWHIGVTNHNGEEFALAPQNYRQFTEDGFFVVGRSEAKRDWPYVHPGPDDTWAGGTKHTFRVFFGIKGISSTGEGKLVLDMVDTQKPSAPELRVEVNDKSFTAKLPGGAGDESVNGRPEKGKPYHLEVAFSANLLKEGLNEVKITTVSGSWFLYDAVALEAPVETTLADTPPAVMMSLKATPVLMERDGQLFQPIEAEVRNPGEPVEARIFLNGVEKSKQWMRSGVQKVELLAAAVEKEMPATVTVEAGNKTMASEIVTLKPVRKWVVYLLPHSHVDIGYTHVQTDVERVQWRNFETAIEVARRSADYPEGSRFKWNVEVLWAVDSYLRNAPFDKQRQFLEAVKSGWVGLQALYGNELTGLCRPEELLRLTSFAQSLSQRAGVPIESAMITDVPGYTWGMVPAFSHSGVKYFSIAPNGGDRIGRTIAAWGDKPFWWIGPSGNEKLLVWMTGTGYYQVFRSPEKLMNYLGDLEAKNYPYDFVQVRHCLGDNGAPDENFPEQVKTWNETHAFPKLVIATSEEMFHAFEERYGDKIPRVSGDFTPYWEDGAASSARETALNRWAADRLVQAETLWAMLAPRQYPAADFAEAWRNVVLYDEHTWGAHNSISEPDLPFVKSQWAIKQANALDADRQSRDLLERAKATRAAAGAGVESVDVFNTTSWLRSDVVMLPRDWALSGECVHGPNGEPVYSQRLLSGQLAFLARNVPAFGAKRFSISAGAPFSPGSARAKALTLTTSTLQVRVDESSGGIASLRTRDIERDFVSEKGGTLLNEYSYLRGANLKNLLKASGVKISIGETGPLIASLVIESEAPGCRKLTREVRVTEGLERVDMINVVDKLPVREKEGVHFGFAFNVPNGVVRMDMPWSVVRPELDQIPGACKNWASVQRWVDIANDELGITWAAPDAPLVEIGGITANVLGSANNVDLWREHIEPTQTIYSWAMNNHWHTNYRADQDGPVTFRYSLQPHRAFRGDEASRFGISLTQPLIAVPAQGVAAYGQPALRLASEGVIVSAFKPSQDGSAFIVRLFGAAGKRESVALDWGTVGPGKVFFSDNSERAICDAGKTVEVPAFGIVTLRTERGGKASAP